MADGRVSLATVDPVYGVRYQFGGITEPYPLVGMRVLDGIVLQEDASDFQQVGAWTAMCVDCDEDQ